MCWLGGLLGWFVYVCNDLNVCIFLGLKFLVNCIESEKKMSV